jgi:hypothetical protein
MEHESLPLPAMLVEQKIPFDEIASGATVQVAVIDGVQYLSVRDVIMCVCDKSDKRASKVWDRLGEDKKKEVSAFCVYL